MSTPTPPAPPADSEPGTPISVPGVALWSDSDSGVRPLASEPFGGLVASASDKAMPTIGHIGRYALKAQLGSGGLGTVFAAHDPLLSRLIAVKTLNYEIKEEERESFNALFLNEARAAGGLSHPHIVTVFDAGISDNRAYIAMELLKGRDLRQLRQEGWRATPAQAALIVRRVADALAFAHSKGVIHRDIKPANIFMVGRTQPRVLDFGIARIAHQRDVGQALDGAGSPYYMAPEQVRRESADRRADVFSLGVVLYELLTDVKPFRGESLKEITQAVLTLEPPLASKVDSTVPRALAEIAARAMAKDPEQRFRSARSFARELRQWLDANPVGADGETSVAAAPAPRRRWLPATLAGALVASAVAGGIVWWRPGEAPAAPAMALAKPLPRLEAAPATAVAVVAPPSAAAASTPSPAIGETAGPGGTPVTPDSLLLVTLGIPSALAAPATANPAPVAAAATASPAATPPVTTPAAAAPAASTTAIQPRPPESPPRATEAGAAIPRETAKEKRAREAREREARAVVAAAPVVAATGTVRIAISPWGEVEVDGTPSGAAPPLTELTLSEGRHQIVVRNGDFAPYVVSVNVTAGQVVSVRHKFGS